MNIPMPSQNLSNLLNSLISMHRSTRKSFAAATASTFTSALAQGADVPMCWPNSLQILITGIGGQGVVGLSGRLRDLLTGHYAHVSTSDQRGVAQRRASTASTVLAGQSPRTPHLNVADADVLIGLEPLEALRAIDRMRPGSWCLLSDVRIETICGAQQKYAYADTADIVREFERRGVRCVLLPVREWLRSQKMEAVYASSVMLGALCAVFGYGLDAAKAAVSGPLNPIKRRKNLDALEWGYGQIAPQQPVGPAGVPEPREIQDMAMSEILRTVRLEAAPAA